MTRQDIGSYLGLKMETVSRILSSLQQANLIAVDHRRIRILDAASLAELSEPPSMDRLHGRGGLAPLTETPHHAAG
jgi:DNA-binding IclR family transcriptional regulator